MKIGVFGLHNCRMHGGLETYTRELAKELVLCKNSVTINGESIESARGLIEIWKPRINRLLPLMTRSSFRWVARGFAELMGSKWCKETTEKLDVIHFVGTGWDLVGFPLVRIAKRKRIPITCWPAVHPGSWGDSPLDIDLYKKMDVVFASSDFEKDHLGGLGVEKQRIVRSGCATSSITSGNGNRFRRVHGLIGREVVLFVGRRSRGKGYHALRVAISELIKQGRNIVLVSAGRDVDPPYPLLPPENHVDLFEVGDSEKHDALAACDLFALPSEFESFGIVYVEAWAYGKPVICGSAPASRELVHRHQAGISTDGTPTAVQRAICTLLDDRLERQKMGERGQAASCAHYTWKTVASQHLEVWKNFVGT